MARGECLAEDTAVIYVYRFICQSIKTFITFVKDRDCNFMTYSCTFCRICIDNNFTFINNCVKFIFNRCVKNFTNMFDLESCVECINADTDTLHITLSCMVYTFDTVDVVMEFTFDNRFKVWLHVLACNFNNIGDAVLASKFHVVYFRSNYCDLVIFYFGSVTCLYKLCTVYTGTIELNLHVFTTDDLTFECGCKCNRNIDICDLDLDITCFKRCSIEFAYVFLNDQALWYTEDVFCFVCDYRESKCDSTSSTGYDHVIQRFECVNECRYTIHCIFHKCACITRCYITEDQCCTKCNGYYMDNCCNVFAKRNNTYVCTCLHSCFCNLVDDSANQCYEDTLCLIALYKSNTFFYGWSRAKDYSYTRDISCYKRYTELTDYCICKMSVAWFFVWCCTIDIFQNFNEFCAKCCSNTGHECIV